jgi:GntR family transcriptional regulator
MGRLEMAWWFMSDLEAPVGRCADLAYVIVADDIAARTASGELPPGARLLAERELARHYGVAYGTIRRAMKELRARGLIRSVQGRGTFVAGQDGQPPGALSRGGIAAPDGHTADRPRLPAAAMTPEAQGRESDGFTAAPTAPGSRAVAVQSCSAAARSAATGVTRADT